MKKSPRKLNLSRETLRQLENVGLKAAGGAQAGGAQTTDFTSDITNCYICPVYPDTL